jgi:23S rRNA (pseudouridine1915-N3)-methyltransferase
VKFVIVAIGHRMPAWVDAGFSEYARRMPREAPLKLIEVKPEPRGEGSQHVSSIERLVEAEGKRLSAALPAGCFTVVLDERGRSCTTRELAERMAAWQMEGRDVAFVIGGADGLPDAIKNSADWLWSLSPLTLPHALARIVVAEQLYRAFSILRHHPYHRQ